MPEASSFGPSLVKRNREIAEVREQLIKADADLDVVQAENSQLLEEVSVLDSELFNEGQRAGSAEQRLAELWDGARRADSELAQQQAAHVAAVAALKVEAAEQTDRLGVASSETEAERRRADGLDAELARLRARLEAEEASLSAFRAEREEKLRAAGAAARQKLMGASGSAAAEEVAEADTRREALDSEERDARRDAQELEAQLTAARARREDLNQSLRRAVADHAADGPRLQGLEAELQARGGRLDELLAGAAPASAANSAEELRAELREAKEQRESLEAQLSRARNSSGQSTIRLQGQLDAARGELQASLREASDAHHSQVYQLEQEIQAERQRGLDDSLAERAAAEQARRLLEERARIAEERGADLLRAQADSGRCAALEEELLRLRSEVRRSEATFASTEDHASRDERRRREAQAEGDRRVAKVRAMIEELWGALRGASIGVGAQSGLGRRPGMLAPPPDTAFAPPPRW